MRYKDLNIRRLDKDNIVVERIGKREKGKNVGEEFSTILSYHPTVKEACRSFVNKMTADQIEKSQHIIDLFTGVQALNLDMARKLEAMCEIEGVE